MRPNSEVWMEVCSCLQTVTVASGKAVQDWVCKKEQHTHDVIKRAQEAVSSLAVTLTFDTDSLRRYFSDVINFTSRAMEELTWWCSCASDDQLHQLKIWMMQLHTSLSLLPSCLSTMVSSHVKEGHAESADAAVSVTVVCERVIGALDEIITVTSHATTLVVEDRNRPGAFVAAVDLVLEILSEDHNIKADNNDLSESRLSRLVINDDDNTTSLDSYHRAAPISRETTEKKRLGYSTKDEASPLKHGLPASPKYHVSPTAANTLASPPGQCTTKGQRVKEPLEEILRHVIAISHCSSPSDTKVIMTLCENVCTAASAFQPPLPSL